jgi:uncharacterized protein (TIGR02466 family)
MEVFNLFPTAVAKFNFDRDFSSEEIIFINSQETHKNVGNTVSNDSYVLRHQVMADIKGFAETSVDKYLRSICIPKNSVSLRITQSWFNYAKLNEFHHKHEHPNSFISGVMYIKASEERDKIHFHRNGYRQIFLPVADWNLYNSESWWLPVNTGDLFIFPSSLTHSVEPVKEERISLSFNTFPVGYVGEEESLTALHLKD